MRKYSEGRVGLEKDDSESNLRADQVQVPTARIEELLAI
jgi:hypothetical protein